MSQSVKFFCAIIRPEFYQPHKKLGMILHVCNAGAGETETVNPGLMRDFISKIRQRSN